MSILYKVYDIPYRKMMFFRVLSIIVDAFFFSQARPKLCASTHTIVRDGREKVRDGKVRDGRIKCVTGPT